jgi:ferredoxin
MSIYRLVVDQDRCIACHACEASCKAAHDSAPGISLGTLLVDGPRFEDAAEEATPIIVKHARPEAPAPLAAESPGLCFIPATGPAYSALSRAVWKSAPKRRLSAGRATGSSSYGKKRASAAGRARKPARIT